MRKLLAIVTLSCVLYTGCAALWPTVRTIVDIATDACELWASEQHKIALSPQDFCDVAENVEPFLQQQRLAQAQAGAVARAQLHAR
jgi:hypothetical protein